MKRLIAALAGAAMILGGLLVGPAPSASADTPWVFADASFTVDNGYGDKGTFAYQNLRIDGSTARGTVRVSAGSWSCPSSTFSGLSAKFFTGFPPDACDGSVEFSVDSAGVLTIDASLKVSFIPFYVRVGTAQATNPPAPQITMCALTFSGTTGTASWTTQGSGFDGFEFGAPGGVTLSPSASERSVAFDMGTQPSGHKMYGIDAIVSQQSTGVVLCEGDYTQPPPGKPSIDTLVPTPGGLLTVNYSLAAPTTVQGIEYALDGGAWTRPGGQAPVNGAGGAFTLSGLSAGQHTVTMRSVGWDSVQTTDGDPRSATIPAANAPGRPVAAPPAAPVSAVPGTSNGAGTGTNGALAATSGDAGIDAPCLAQDGTLYPNLYSTVGSQLTMAPNTHGLGTAKSFTVTGGALPPGMQLDRTYGVLFGVTTQSGSWVTTVRAKLADGSVKSGTFTTRVDADPQTLQYAAQNIGSVGTSIAIAPTTNAPVTGTTYELVCGKVPAGTRFDTRTGLITGRPTGVVTLPTPLRVAESSASGTAAASFIFVVNRSGATSFSYPAHPHVRAGKRIAIRPTVAGVGDIAVFRTSKGKLPKGLHVNPRTGVISGRIAHRGPIHTITMVAVTKGGALLTAAPMRLSLGR